MIHIYFFILQGYDLAESFIVTQDPMENTIADFWRMVFDQEVTTIVMLSEVSLCGCACVRECVRPCLEL